jgi:hypothetical protein
MLQFMSAGCSYRRDLLEEGRLEEVKALAGELAQVFEDKGVHREALAALRLFHKAAEQSPQFTDVATFFFDTRKRPLRPRSTLRLMT